MKRVLLVEDQQAIGTVLKGQIEGQLGWDVRWTETYQETVRCLKMSTRPFFVALVDLNLPDAPAGEIVDLVLEHNIPPIVFTGEMSDSLQDEMWEKKIIDYVLKEGQSSVEYLLSLLNRLRKNKEVEVLVVDDSKIARKKMSELLQRHLYRVFEAGDGLEALAVLEEHPRIRLVVTDYNMPHMDGFELISEIRKRHGKDEVGIIGLSSYGSQHLSARFIKYGANDFLMKPFINDEFYCRIFQNIELLEQIQKIWEFSNKDYLTGLSNRRYLFQEGKKMLLQANQESRPFAVAMLDIDYFKKINDRIGHEAGDKALQYLARKVEEQCGEKEIAARFGGEEFCLLLTGQSEERFTERIEELRRAIASMPVDFGGETINITVSIGICKERLDSLEAMLVQADDMLYEAKGAGRNCIRVAAGSVCQLQNGSSGEGL
jgi:diguanylate cyclase (GGDEF)-like protein